VHAYSSFKFQPLRLLLLVHYLLLLVLCDT